MFECPQTGTAAPTEHGSFVQAAFARLLGRSLVGDGSEASARTCTAEMVPMRLLLQKSLSEGIRRLIKKTKGEKETKECIAALCGDRRLGNGKSTLMAVTNRQRLHRKTALEQPGCQIADSKTVSPYKLGSTRNGELRRSLVFTYAKYPPDLDFPYYLQANNGDLEQNENLMD